MSKPIGIDLTRSAKNVWFTLDRQTLLRLHDMGISHPIPNEDLQIRVSELEKAGYRINLYELEDES